jgi:hypothetical protein
MKRIVMTVAGFVVLIAVWMLLNQPPAIALSPSATVGESDPLEYLIILPMPDARTLEVPPSLTRRKATNYARDLTFQQAVPLMAKLQQQQVAGGIIRYEVRPEQHAVVVQMARSNASDVPFRQLATMGSVIPAGDSQAACAIDSAQQLSEQVFALSQRANRITADRPSGVSGTNPSIVAYVPPGAGGGDEYTYFYGYTQATTVVTMRLLRNGRVIGTGSTTSAGDGYYSFYPDYLDCPASGYTWVLMAGDMIEAAAAGNKVSMTVANIAAWVDPVTNVVAGMTAPGRTVNVQMNYSGADLCFSSSAQLSTVADSGGNFNVNFSAVADFDRTANAYVKAEDASGNGNYYYFYPYQINAGFDDTYIEGYLKPGVPFTATLRRGGVITSTTIGTSDASGYYYSWFNTGVDAGDIVSVTSGAITIQFTVAPLNNFAINTTTNQVIGTTTPGRRVASGMMKRTSGYVRTTCLSYQGWCHSVIANGAGNFTLTAGGDLARGDYAYLNIYDAEGNSQYGRFTSSAIIANMSNNQVQGYWRNPYTYLTIILKESGGAIKEIRSNIYANYESRYSAWLYSSTLMPGDKIEVGDGVVTDTMTVQNMTERFDGGSGHFSGSAVNGGLLAQLWDFRRETGYWSGYCTTATLSGGSYDVTFSGAQSGAQDYVTAYKSGPDEHYTVPRYAHAFTVNGVKDTNYQGWVSGYSETPYALITLTLKSGVTTKASYTGTTSSNGYYGGYLLNAAIAQGDTLQVQTSDNDSATVTIPELTVNKNTGTNQVVGRSPANQPVETRLWRQVYDPDYEEIDSYGVLRIATANNTSDYAASYSGLNWDDCAAVQIGHPCTQAQATYYNALGHGVLMYTPPPATVTADLYEMDDLSTSASSYIGIQHHTFHVVTDMDWITFTVPPQDVINAVQYRLTSSNVGAGVSSEAILYDTDGTTPLMTGYSYNGYPFYLSFTPTAAGTYYLRIRQSDPYFIPYCDAMYDLTISAERFKIYLPLILR